ncbi:MAG: rhodanese-like domain-containing protein [Deferrisomatales bacterium]|nr:rhodanese-like domain-containing protein [Deferrisomatales bacterium]
MLIDLRAPEVVRAGHLPRAVNISPDALGGMEAQFPPDKSAPIVFYSDDQQTVLDALEYMVDWGYTKASRVNNALAAWKARGWELATGPAGESIAYVRKLGPNEAAAEEFLEAVEKGSAVIVDARSKDEFEGGHFKGALSLPAEEGGNRFGEIPADRPILVYCSTGSRAEMLFDVLHEKGYKDVKYLVAHVEIDATGKGTVAQ